MHTAQWRLFIHALQRRYPEYITPEMAARWRDDVQVRRYLSFCVWHLQLRGDNHCVIITLQE